MRLRINLAASLNENPSSRAASINIRLIAHNIIVRKKYSPTGGGRTLKPTKFHRRSADGNGRRRKAEGGPAHNANLSIIRTFQSENSFPVRILKRAVELQNFRAERRIRATQGKAELVTAKPARRRDSARGLGSWLARDKKGNVQSHIVHSDISIPGIFPLWALTRYVGFSHRGLSASLRKRQITKIMEAAWAHSIRGFPESYGDTVLSLQREYIWLANNHSEMYRRIENQ